MRQNVYRVPCTPCGWGPSVKERERKKRPMVAAPVSVSRGPVVLMVVIVTMVVEGGAQ